jgi:hypothetical protein
MFQQNYYSGILRFGYSIPAKLRGCIGTPTF